MVAASLRADRRLLWLLAAPLLGLLVSGPTQAESSAQADAKTIVLLHGLIRSPRSMGKMGAALEAQGYRVCNIAYPSTRHDVRTLSVDHVLPAIKRCIGDSGDPVGFVTHSLGGIIVRYLAQIESDIAIGRVVMLGPPNQGSEVVDRIGHWWLFGRLNGPAGLELGTDASGMPRQLGPANFEVGVIAGNRSINWINSTMMEGPDDGKVAVARARLAGMRDFRVMPVTHTMMMRNRRVIGEVIAFLREGRFTPSD